MAEEDTVEELWGNSVAAQFLAEQMPVRKADGWNLWLRNNRNQSRRASYRIPIVRISNGSFYQPAEVQKFVEWEKSRQIGTIKLTGRSLEVMRAFGVGEPGGSTRGRKLEVVGISREKDTGSGDWYVRFVTADPLMVYRLTPEQARSVGQQLLDATSPPAA